MSGALALRAKLAALRRSSSGAALMEFALCLPFFVGVGMYGVEVASMAMANMQVSQLAISVADNASRMEQTNNNAVTPTVTEADIDSVMTGALREGESFGFQRNGRIILSSLERRTNGQQFIRWQRCRGALAATSDYGGPGTTVTGLGAGGTQVRANANSAVMFAEVVYVYKGIFGNMFVKDTTFRQESAFIIRDVRNLEAGVTGTNGNSSCAST